LDTVLKKKRGISKKLNKNRGLRYYRKKQYVKSISFLEKALQEEKDDPEVYLFLGYASLFTDDTEGARRYFRGGLLVKEDDIELMKGLAYVYLKDERIEDAINLWGEILEKNPRDRRIKRALQNLRESNNIESFIQNARLRDFLSVGPPVYVKIKPYIIALSISLGAFIIGIVFYTTPLYKKALEKFYPEVTRLNRIEFPTGVSLTEEDSSALYSFSEKDIEASFLRIKKHIYKNRVNTAIIELNRIMLSNASPPVKEKFEILYKFLDTPDPLAIDYNPHFYEIMKEPAAFKGVFILWKGKIANLKKEKKSAEFDLLVNYEDEDTIAGIAHINISGTFFIENKQNVEVFGSYGGYAKETGKLLIQGILLRDLGI
jgi:tetratricopeptide (TPR) repeat protein